MELVVEKKNESLDCIRKKKSHDKKEKVTSIFFFYYFKSRSKTIK